MSVCVGKTCAAAMLTTEQVGEGRGSQIVLTATTCCRRRGPSSGSTAEARHTADVRISSGSSAQGDAGKSRLSQGVADLAGPRAALPIPQDQGTHLARSSCRQWNGTFRDGGWSQALWHIKVFGCLKDVWMHAADLGRRSLFQRLNRHGSAASGGGGDVQHLDVDNLDLLVSAEHGEVAIGASLTLFSTTS